MTPAFPWESLPSTPGMCLLLEFCLPYQGSILGLRGEGSTHNIPVQMVDPSSFLSPQQPHEVGKAERESPGEIHRRVAV